MAKRNTETKKKIDPRMTLIGQRVKDLRIQKGYTSYEDFSYDAGIGRMAYWRAESGKYNITMNSLFAILDAHDLSMSEFFEPFDSKSAKG